MESIHYDDHHDSDGDDSHHTNNMNDAQDDAQDELFNQKTLNLQRQHEIQQLTQLIRTTQPTNTDSIANIIMQQLNNNRLETTTTTTTTTINNNKTQHTEDDQLKQSSILSTAVVAAAAASTTAYSYPPMNQTGSITPHDRPYADYGHLDRQTIANEFHFNLEQPPINRQPTLRLHAKSFAITSWTNVSKDLVMNEIKRQFGIDKIQYICIGEEISESNHREHLHIQIIFKETIDRRKPFLDEITKTHCYYQVTRNDCAWNEYIKKGGNYIEFNEFKSTRARGTQKQWPSSQSSSSSSTPLHIPSNHLSVHSTITTTVDDSPPTTTINTTSSNSSTAAAAAATTTTKTVRAQAEERRQQKEIIAKQAIEIAKKDVDAALKYIKDHFTWDFIHHFQWYQAAFTYIYLQEQQELAAQTHRRHHSSKKYTWPESFPDCTPELRKVVDRWIKEEFNRTSRAKCLILIGRTGTGKTTFAKSLSAGGAGGDYKYFKGRWRLDSWNDNARYLIFDDIDWDKYEQLGYPSKKDLLTQNGPTNATDKYKKTQEINVQQPAIVLLNPGKHEGSLTALPTNNNEQEEANYWQQRAIVYRMGPNEYFHKPAYHTDHNHT